ncbi:MAG: cytochrome c oxidase subunit II [Solirubrobacterales bacterium]
MPRPTKPLRIVLRALLLAGLLVALAAPLAHGSAITPPTPESPNASDIESSYLVTLIVFIIVVVLVNAALVYAAVRFRARGRNDSRPRPARRRSPLKVSSVLAVVAGALFAVGVVFAERASDVESSGPDGLQASSARTAQLDIAPPVADATPLTIQVSGQQWLWRYAYPDENNTFSFYELVVPVDTTVILELTSTDVVHTWWVPALGGKFQVEPGQTSRTWFKAEREGVFDGQSAQFSGPGYASMRARVRVVSPTDYNAWLSQQSQNISEAQAAVQEQVASGNVPGLGALE